MFIQGRTQDFRGGGLKLPEICSTPLGFLFFWSGGGVGKISSTQKLNGWIKILYFDTNQRYCL